MTGNPHIGSDFEDFLSEEGILAECQLAATKALISLQIADAMKAKGLTRTAMAAEMKTTRHQLDHLLDPDNDSVTLATLKLAAKALGKTLRLELA
jgi:antitoxin HicB